MKGKNKGQTFKVKTKKWFIERGYACEYAELLRTIFLGPGKLLYQKKDLFGADGIAMNGHEIIFWNSKATDQSHHVREGIEEFNKFPFPPFVKRWLVVWTTRVKEPTIYDVETGTSLMTQKVERTKKDV